MKVAAMRAGGDGKPRSFFLITVATLLCLAGGQGTAWADFVPLGDLPGGLFLSEASGVSADGSVVVGTSVSASGAEAFRWMPREGMVGLGFLPGFPTSAALATSANGSVVVGTGVGPGKDEAVRWTAANGMVGLGFLSGFADSRAFGVLQMGRSQEIKFGPGPADNFSFRWTSGAAWSAWVPRLGDRAPLRPCQPMDARGGSERQARVDKRSGGQRKVAAGDLRAVSSVSLMVAPMVRFSRDRRPPRSKHFAGHSRRNDWSGVCRGAWRARPSALLPMGLSLSAVISLVRSDLATQEHFFGTAPRGCGT